MVISCLITEILWLIKAQILFSRELQANFDAVRPYKNCSDAAFDKALDLLEVTDKIEYDTFSETLSIVFCTLHILFLLIWAPILRKYIKSKEEMNSQMQDEFNVIKENEVQAARL